MSVRIVIPGEPVAQGRGRAVRFRRGDGATGVRVVDPQNAREWKASAAWHMRQAHPGRPFDGPVAIDVTFAFTCPRSQHRKRTPRPGRYHDKRPDVDNLLKALLDAGTGILWQDDTQVASLRARKWIAPQGEAPGVWVAVWPIETP